MGKSIRDKFGVRKEEPDALLITMDRDGLEQTVPCIYNLPNTLLRLKEGERKDHKTLNGQGLGKEVSEM